MADDAEMQVPEPEGPSVRSEGTQRNVKRAGNVAVLVIGGTAAFLLLAVVATPTSGALRSQQVKWQERQRDMAETMAKEQGQTAMGLAAVEATPEEECHE